MGVPKFYRWISERYPCLSEVVKDYQIPEFDNLYLDMNGIIHVCSHPEDDNPHFRITEEKIFQDIFHYIEVLFRMIKPRKVFFMAVDGVAPRAKMNQQRGRRFRSAREAEMLVRKAVEKGETLPTEARFDSNCITPGTEFMAKLQEQLKFFVVKKISSDKLWQGPKIYLSGHEKWRVYEDGVLANRIQDEEFEYKYGLNRFNRRTVRDDIPVAKVVHSKEEEEAQKKLMQHIEKQKQIAERDAEVARKAQEEEESRIEYERLMRSQEDALIATQFQTAEMIDAERARVQMEMTDEQYARKMQEKEKERYERKKQERQLSKQRKLLQREQAQVAGDVLAGRMESSDPPSQGFRDMRVSDPDRVLRTDGRLEDAGDFSDFYIQPSEDMDPMEMKELRELQDEELARLLQDQEKKRGAAVDKSKLKEIEDKDAQIAKLIYEQEKLKLKKAKSQRQRQKSEEQRQNPRDQPVNRSVSLPVAYPVHQYNSNQYNEQLEQRLGRVTVDTESRHHHPESHNAPPQQQHSPGSYGSDDRELPPYRPPPPISAHHHRHNQPSVPSHVRGDETPPYTRPPVPPHPNSLDYTEYANRPLPDTPPGGVIAGGQYGYPPDGNRQQRSNPGPEGVGNVFTSLDPTFAGERGGAVVAGSEPPVPPKGQTRSQRSPHTQHTGSGSSGRDPVEYADLNEMGPVQAQKRSSLHRDKKKNNCKQQ